MKRTRPGILFLSFFFFFFFFSLTLDFEAQYIVKYYQNLRCWYTRKYQLLNPEVFKVEMHTKQKIGMLCTLSQNYKQFF